MIMCDTELPVNLREAPAGVVEGCELFCGCLSILIEIETVHRRFQVESGDEKKVIQVAGNAQRVTRPHVQILISTTARKQTKLSLIF